MDGWTVILAIKCNVHDMLFLHGHLLMLFHLFWWDNNRVFPDVLSSIASIGLKQLLFQFTFKLYSTSGQQCCSTRSSV
jgi:hypothetical protein